MITEKDIEHLLQEKIDILVKEIVEAMPELPQAIYLVGGYGRGEGAWYEDAIGLHPYNDFDLAVITENPLSFERTEVLRKELAKAVDIKWVDIDYYSINSLKSMIPTIHNVDLIEGGSLIYGNDVIKENNLYLNKKEIGKEDLILLYRTRMWTFVGSWEGAFSHLNVEDARFFKNQMAKAVLAACDMRLVKLKKYAISYRERAKLVMEEFITDDNMKELVEWAINEKMRPSGTELMQQQMESLYFRVKDMYNDSFSYAFGKNARFFINPDKTKQYYLLHTKIYLHHLYSLLCYRKSRIERGLDVFYAMNYVYHANNHGRIDYDYLEKASKLLMKHGYINHPNNSWDELRLMTANARNNV